MGVSTRPLVCVTGLTVGDYLLWNWSLGAGHVTLALIAGFTILPLAAASAVLLAVSLALVLARSTLAVTPGRRVRRGRASVHPAPPALAPEPARPPGRPESSRHTPDKLAA